MMRRNTLNRTLKYLFILYGIWPGIPCVLICRVFWVVTILFIEYSIFRYLLAHVYTAELLDLVDGLCSFLAYGKVLTKFIVFWLKQRKFIEIMSMMSDDWDESVKSDVALRETQHKAKLSDRVMNSVFVLHTITIIGYSFGIIINDIDVTNHTSELPYVEKVDIPFEVNTQLTYRSILIAEFLFVIMCAWAAGVTNALLMCLTLHVAGQIDILRKCLTQIVPRANENKDQSIDVALNQVIQKHQRIIIFSKNVENLYTQIAFLQFASNMIMICSLGFLIVKAVGSPDAVKQIIRSLLFYTITNLEAFIFCFAGEYLSNKSKLISLAAYNSEWYDLKPRNARVLLFVILRSQKQLILTAGKMMDLSLESFASSYLIAAQKKITQQKIMNASGSYLSVLLAMQ